MARKQYEKNNNGNLKFNLSEKVDFKFWEERECPICGRHFYARKKYKKKKESGHTRRNVISERQMKGCDADGTRSFTGQLPEMTTVL